jgi:hypothetical protein
VPNRTNPIQLSIPREYTLSEMGAPDNPVYNITFRPADLTQQPYPGVHFYQGSVFFSHLREAKASPLAMLFTVDLFAEESIIRSRFYYRLVHSICSQAFSSHFEKVRRGPTLKQLKTLRLALS